MYYVTLEDWDCGTEESPLNEDEFVVDKILARRLVCKIESGMPEDEHYGLFELTSS